MSDAEESAVYSVEQASKRLGLSRGATYEGIKRGEIPALRIGRRIVIPKARFDHWLANGADVTDREIPSTDQG
jgi:excisionase family DNA binding protein